MTTPKRASTTCLRSRRRQRPTPPPPPPPPVCPRLDDPVELRPLRRTQQAGTSWTRPIHQPCDAVHSVAVHPVPQGLSLHPGALRCRRTRLAIQDRRNRKTATGLGNTPARPRRTANILGRQIQACDRKCHRTAPATQQDTQSHAKPSPSFKKESGPAAVGMRCKMRKLV